MISKPFLKIGSQKIGLSSFTLVELMLVVAVIGIVAGIVLGAAGGVQKKAARDQARAEIKTMCAAMERYKTDFGAFPQTGGAKTNVLYGYLTNYMTFRTNQVISPGPTGSILDPYGRPYFYACPPINRSQMVMDGFEIWSDGPKTTDKKDDIGSWN